MRKTIALLAILLPLSAQAELKQIFESKLYPLGEERKTATFLFHHYIEQLGDQETTVNHYLSPTGDLPVVEEKCVVKGGKLVRFEVLQRQLGARGVIEVKGDKVHYLWEKGEDKDEDTGDYEENFVVGPTLISYIRKHLPKLMEGKTLSIRFGVVDRTDDYGFKLVKEAEKTIHGRPTITIKMSPSSPFVSMALKPFYFTLDKENLRMVEYQGRATPKVKDGDSWKDFDADVTYRYL